MVRAEIKKCRLSRGSGSREKGDGKIADAVAWAMIAKKNKKKNKTHGVMVEANRVNDRR